MPLRLRNVRYEPIRVLSLVMVILIGASLITPTTSAAPGTIATPERMAAITPPTVTAKSIYVIDMTSGVELYAKDPYAHLQVGSLVKLVTALVAVDNVELDEHVKIIESDLVDTDMYSNMSLQAGDTLTVSQLLYGLLIPSGNDGAHALARHVGAKLSGSDDPATQTEAFVREMNAYAENLGIENSRFTVPDGIDTPNSYSSAYDVTILARELMKNEFLRSVVNEPGYRFISVGPEARVYEKSTTNQLLGQFGVIGVKTGTTEQAGGNVVLAREINAGNNDALITIIGADHDYETNLDARWDDASMLISDMDTRFAWTDPTADGVLPGLTRQMQVWDVAFKSPPAIPVPTDDIQLGFRLQVGPVTNPGERAGSVHLYFGNDEVGSVPIFQEDDIAGSWPITGMAA